MGIVYSNVILEVILCFCLNEKEKLFFFFLDNSLCAFSSWFQGIRSTCDEVEASAAVEMTLCLAFMKALVCL